MAEEWHTSDVRQALNGEGLSETCGSGVGETGRLGGQLGVPVSISVGCQNLPRLSHVDVSVEVLDCKIPAAAIPVWGSENLANV